MRASAARLGRRLRAGMSGMATHARATPPPPPPRRAGPSYGAPAAPSRPRRAPPPPPAPPPGTREVVEGEVTVVTFHSLESGYGVVKLRLSAARSITVVGTLPSLAKGQRLRVSGSWVSNEKFGSQLKVDSLEELQPQGQNAILSFLGGGLVPGLGPATAAKLVAAFGDETLAVFAAPDAAARLASVAGVGPRTAAKLKAGWDASAGERDAVAFLTRLGLSGRLAQGAVKALGGAAHERVRADPFAALAGVRGASFETADGIAQQLGMPADAPGRVRAALREALLGKARKSGHVFLPWREAAAATLRLLLAPRAGAAAAAEAAEAAEEAAMGGAQAEWAEDGVTDGLPQMHHVYRAARALEAAGELAVEPPPPPPPAAAAAAAGAMEQHRPEEESDVEDYNANARLYLPELLLAERKVSAWLAAAAAASARGSAPSNMEAWLDANERQLHVQLSAEQRRAVTEAASRRLVILTGGPGTGKTFVMALAVRLWLARGRKVRLAAPTGRAAQRMAELMAEVAALSPEMAQLEPPSTIHRLLEYVPQGELGGAGGGAGAEAGGVGGGEAAAPGAAAADLDISERFMRNEDNLLDLDALVVDEASMLDLPLAAALLQAMPRSASLLLIGDPDQLPPVGPGSPLLDALRSGVAGETRLSALFRQYSGSLIARATQAVHSGAFPPLVPVCFPEGEEEAAEEGPPAGGPPAAASALLAKLKPRLPWDPRADGFSARAAAPVPASLAVRAGLDALWLRLPEHGDGGDMDDIMRLITRLVSHTLPAAGFRPQTDLQVLIPMRKGPLGSAALCAQLAPLLNPRAPRAQQLRVGGANYAVGDRVLQQVNDYEKEVFNGDLGLVVRCEAEARALTVAFPGRGELRYAGAELDALTPAWAVTVHKAQGCEFPVVLLVLHPAHRPLLYRNMLYTAMSRASKLLVVISAAGPLDTAVRVIRSDDERHSALAPRLVADFEAAAARLAARPPPPPPRRPASSPTPPVAAARSPRES